MTIDILRKTGGWCVELQQPLKAHAHSDITAIEIRKLTADIVIRWNQWKIPSTLALLSELCDVPERLIRQLLSDDFDRVIFALINVVPAAIKLDMEQGHRPLATPEEELPEQERYVPPPDQIDPRFPAVDGPVRRMKPVESPPLPPPPPVEEEDGGSMNMTASAAIQAVR